MLHEGSLYFLARALGLPAHPLDGPICACVSLDKMVLIRALSLWFYLLAARERYIGIEFEMLVRHLLAGFESTSYTGTQRIGASTPQCGMNTGITTR